MMNGSDAPLEAESNFSCPDEVVKRIAQLYDDLELTDVTFVVHSADGERTFRAHKNIVCSWSQPLRSMLCGSFAEGSSDRVVIQDVEPQAFEAMLKIMYKGTVAIDVDNVLAILDVSVRFDVTPLLQFAVQFLQNHMSSEHACRMLEVGVRYGLTKLQDKCIELIVTDAHILGSEDFSQLSQAAVVELAKHDSWNMHEDEIFDAMVKWGVNNRAAKMTDEEHGLMMKPILQELRYPHMSVEKLKVLSQTSQVPSDLIFEALFFKLNHSVTEDTTSSLTGRYRPRPGSLLFSWVPTNKVTVGGDYCEGARHTSSNGFTGVRGDRRMQYGVYSWSIDIAETQSSWIFVGVAQADDPNDVAWRSTGYMLYCLDSRYFHHGSGQNHPQGDRKIQSGDCIRVELDCSRNTLAFGINAEKPIILFRDLPPVAYVPAVDLRDCGDKVRILSSNPHVRANAGQWCCGGSSPPTSRHQQPSQAGPAPTRAHSLPVEVDMYVSLEEEAFPPSALTRRLSASATEVPVDVDIQAPVPPASMPLLDDQLHSRGGTPLGNFGRWTDPSPSAPPASSPFAPSARRSEPRDPAASHAAQGGAATAGSPEGTRSSAGGHTQHYAASGGGGTSRTLQPRQSQGAQGGAPAAAAQDRVVGGLGGPSLTSSGLDSSPGGLDASLLMDVPEERTELDDREQPQASHDIDAGLSTRSTQASHDTPPMRETLPM